MTSTAQTLLPAGYRDAAPLDWAQFRTLLWNELPAIRRSPGPNWEDIAKSINQKCDVSIPQSPFAYQQAFAKLVAAWPETLLSDDEGIGFRVWTEILYQSAQELFAGPVFMNLGYASETEDAPALDKSDEPFRLAIQLYEHLLSKVEVEGRNVLEIGCGGGGGCSYITRYVKPRLVVGIDLVEPNLRTCTRTLGGNNSRFVRANAELLPFASNQFDTVVNIESSLHYGSVPQFLQETYRVLRAGGFLLLADLRPVGDDWGIDRTTNELYRQITAAGFQIVEFRDISAAVLRSMNLQNKLKEQWLETTQMPLETRAHFREILLCEDSENFRSLNTGRWRYLSYVCSKRE